jgi:hypothetical protein
MRDKTARVLRLLSCGVQWAGPKPDRDAGWDAVILFVAKRGQQIGGRMIEMSPT